MKYIPGDYLMKLVKRMPRVCKNVKAKGGSVYKSQKKEMISLQYIFIECYQK